MEFSQMDRIQLVWYVRTEDSLLGLKIMYLRNGGGGGGTILQFELTQSLLHLPQHCNAYWQVMT